MDTLLPSVLAVMLGSVCLFGIHFMSKLINRLEVMETRGPRQQDQIDIILKKVYEHDSLIKGDKKKRKKTPKKEEISNEENLIELGKKDSLDQVLSLLNNTTSTIKRELMKANSDDSEKCEVIENMFGVIESQIHSLNNSDLESVDSKTLTETIIANAHSLIDRDISNDERLDNERIDSRPLNHPDM